MSDEAVKADYARLGVVDSEDSDPQAWALDTRINADYRLCETYPRVLAMPAAASDELKHQVAAYRSRGRLPVLCWRDPSGKGGCLVRCSQPCTGLLGQTASADQEWMRLLHSAGGLERPLALLDARSFAAAHANKFRGGGVEASTRYGVKSMEHFSLRNVHHIRRVVAKLRATHRSTGVLERRRHARIALHWLSLQSALVRSAARVARLLQEGAVCVLHCSDGWDRTPQLSALAQLLIDPHYRTRRGFLLLVEKEWLGFGHRFQLRYTLGQPIFLQFLDAVRQLLLQQPRAFAFNEAFLADLAAFHDGLPPAGCTSAYPRQPFDVDCDAVRAAESVPTSAAWDFLLDDERRAAYTSVNEAADNMDEEASMRVDSRPSALSMWDAVYSARATPATPKRRGAVACCMPRRDTSMELIIDEDATAHARSVGGVASLSSKEVELKEA
jgi:hypothetical protein